MTGTKIKECEGIKGGEVQKGGERGSGRSRETFEEEDKEQNACINKSFRDSCLWGLFVMNSLSVTIVTAHTHMHTYTYIHTFSCMLKSCLQCDPIFMGVSPSSLLCSCSSCSFIPFFSHVQEDIYINCGRVCLCVFLFLCVSMCVLSPIYSVN